MDLLDKHVLTQRQVVALDRAKQKMLLIDTRLSAEVNARTRCCLNCAHKFDAKPMKIPFLGGCHLLKS